MQRSNPLRGAKGGRNKVGGEAGATIVAHRCTIVAWRGTVYREGRGQAVGPPPHQGRREGCGTAGFEVFSLEAQGPHPGEPLGAGVGALSLVLESCLR